MPKYEPRKEFRNLRLWAWTVRERPDFMVDGRDEHLLELAAAVERVVSDFGHGLGIGRRLVEPTAPSRHGVYLAPDWLGIE